MLNTSFFTQTENRKVTSFSNKYHVVEYIKDLSVNPMNAVGSYYAAEMNIRKRQVGIGLQDDAVVIQAGAMQWFGGAVQVATDVKGAGDLIGKFIGSKVTGETAIKPKYYGSGLVVLEPTYKHILFEDLSQWGPGMVIQDGLFLACDASVNMKVVARHNLSSTVAGGEGLFNTCLVGPGVAVLESPVPREELVVIDLQNDQVKIDGSYAIAWSNSLEFTVERTTKTLIGSAASGEGLVNVYRGTGRILMAPVA